MFAQGQPVVNGILGRQEIGVSARKSAQPLFQFGVVADVQYADKDSQGKRRYREGANKLSACVAEFNRHDLAFVMNLGDIIDGHGAASVAELELIAGIFGKLKAPVRHVIGNHCLEAPRPALLKMLKLEEPPYYQFQQQGWRFLVLYGMDVSLKAPPDSPELALARDYLGKHPSLAEYNGSLGEKQMSWLKEQLNEAQLLNQKVIIFCHHPTLPAASERSLLLWNYPAVLKILESSGKLVVAYMCGHDHRGGYARQAGIHHVTFPGIVEAPADGNSYAIVTVFEDRLEIQGFGTVPNRVLTR